MMWLAGKTNVLRKDISLSVSYHIKIIVGKAYGATRSELSS